MLVCLNVQQRFRGKALIKCEESKHAVGNALQTDTANKNDLPDWLEIRQEHHLKNQIIWIKSRGEVHGVYLCGWS